LHLNIFLFLIKPSCSIFNANEASQPFSPSGAAVPSKTNQLQIFFKLSVARHRGCG
jgi:hypothetical protein